MPPRVPVSRFHPLRQLLRTPASRFYSSTTTSTPPSLTARDINNLKLRIGKCLGFGLPSSHLHKVGQTLKILATEWRDLLAGGEGFLTYGNGRRPGLWRREVVWGEMVSHVNNVTYNRYAESARINWAANYANTIDPKHKKQWSELWTPRGDGLILRSIRTDFKFPMTFPDHVTVYHKLTHLPEPTSASFILDVLILSERHQRPAARCVEDIVLYDYRKAQKLKLEARPFMLNAFRQTWELQERIKTEIAEKAKEIEEAVRELEKASWDQPDAREDFGGASP